MMLDKGVIQLSMKWEKVLDSFNDYSVEYNEGFLSWNARAYIEDRFVRIEAFPLAGDRNLPQRFSFSGDRGEVIRILGKLPPECGTFLVVTDGDYPELVNSGTSME